MGVSVVVLHTFVLVHTVAMIVLHLQEHFLLAGTGIVDIHCASSRPKRKARLPGILVFESSYYALLLIHRFTSDFAYIPTSLSGPELALSSLVGFFALSHTSAMLFFNVNGKALRRLNGEANAAARHTSSVTLCGQERLSSVTELAMFVTRSRRIHRSKSRKPDKLSLNECVEERRFIHKRRPRIKQMTLLFGAFDTVEMVMFAYVLYQCVTFFTHP